MKTEKGADGKLIVSDIDFRPRTSMATDRCIVLDDVMEPDAFKMVSDWVICEKFSCIESMVPWTSTWRYAGIPPGSSKPYLVNAGPFGNYVDVMGFVFRQVAKRFPQYVTEGWKDLRIHSQLSHAGTRLSWHSDHHCYGSFTYYAHPHWQANWGGEMMIADCPPLKEPKQWTYDMKWENEKVGCGLGHYIMPKPNRLVLTAPRVWHSVNRIDPDAGAALRVAVVGFLMSPDGGSGY